MALKFSGGHDIDPYKGEREGNLREVGNQAVWTLSSCKAGFGVEQLRDNSLDTYWQSDGPQPHLINIQFRRKTTISDICIYADYKSDESYTPNRISIRAGSHLNDLTEVEQIELSEPGGWILVPIKDSQSKSVRTFMIQIAVISNHQNGRDTHMRQIKIHSPVQNTSIAKTPMFSSVDASQYSCIR
ncbi:unnamed protein product [Owenia fusiformis]|uniref:Anaphase-promoting complex subunit 10 n=1 Tax=Owenia fusiformis TaxID=6347 RepID=A0A8J1XKI4_OWEFU|nr:unnamed protein product [Owenia fusiformis]